MTRKCRLNPHRRAFSRLAAMRRPATLALALALGCAAAFALASCGGGEDAKLLPGATAREITENLDAVEQLAGEGECVGAANEAQEVSAQVETLSGVDPKLKQALEAGAARLNEVVAECSETATETTEASTEETTTEEERRPPGQEKKEEKEREREEAQREKEEATREEHEAPPEKTTPESPTTPTPAPSEGGGTGAPGGVSPGEPATPGGE